MWVYGNPWSQADPRYLRTGSGQMTRLEDNKNGKSEEQISAVQTSDQDYNSSSGKKKKKKKEKLKLSWSQELQDAPEPEGVNATSQDLDLILRNVPDFTLQKRGNLRPGQKVKLSKIKPRKSAKIFPDGGEVGKLQSEGEFEQKDLTIFSNTNNNNNNNESDEVERNEAESKTKEIGDVDNQGETNEDLETGVDENKNIKTDEERPDLESEENGQETREENTEEDNDNENDQTTDNASKEEEDSPSVSAENENEKDGEEEAAYSDIAGIDTESSAVREEPGPSPEMEDTEDSYSLSRETVLENDLHVSEAETPEPMADIELDGEDSLKNEDREVVVEESTTGKDLDIEDTNDVLTILERENGLNFSRDIFPEQTLDTTIDQVVSQVSTKAVIDQSMKDEEKADFAAFNWKPNVDFFQFGSETQQSSENIFSFGGGTPSLPQTVKKRQIVTRPRSRSIQRLKRSGLA